MAMSKKSKIALSVVGGLVVLGALGSGGEESKVEHDISTQIESNIEDTKLQEIEEDFEVEDTIIKDYEDTKREQLVEAMVSIAEEHMGEMFHVEYSSEYDAITLHPSDPDLILELSMVAINHPESVYVWKNDVVPGMKGLSRSMSDLDNTISLWIVNPENSELVLLNCWQGNVIYDFTDDL